MITAHGPSGYILGKSLPNAQLVFAAAFFGAVLPDLDLIWFYFIDDRAFHHHRYWVHIPVFWAMVASVTIPITAPTARRFLPALLAFFAGIFLHILLDSLAGGILWQWPWSDEITYGITVPARFDNWVLNSILHPVFLLEILIWVVAILIWRKTHQNQN